MTNTQPILANSARITEIADQNPLEDNHIGSAQSKALQALAFPEISFAEFKTLPYSAQKNLVARNRIINTDTYNRTMNELSGTLEKLPSSATETGIQLENRATFVLQLRRAPYNYLFSSGVEEAIEELTLLPISKAELNFAIEYYKHTNVPFFNEKMWRDVIENNEGKLPFEIRGVRDGTFLLPGETMLTVKGPEELVAHFEHVFHRIFYSTLVASQAHALSRIISDPSRFVEVGKRSTVTEEQHLLALRAAYIGGGFTFTSNDAGAVILPLRDTGTIGHRYVQRFSSEEKAFRHAIEELDAVTLLVDLVDTYKGIDLALDLKQEYRESGKRIWVRLDSGNILEQVRYFLKETTEKGMTDAWLDRVVVEGIESLDEIAEIEAMIVKEFGAEALKRVIYGAGGLLVSNKTGRSDASSGFKLGEYTEVDGTLQPTMKFSNSPGKISYPGAPHLVIADGRRTISQEGEKVGQEVLDLFEPLYINGQMFCQAGDAEGARERVKRQSALIDLESLTKEQVPQLRAVSSPETAAKIEFLHRKYGLAA